MRELDQILELWRQTEAAGESAVLATVVKTHGSSYRLPGARLLITAQGRRAGSVSGGCLEDDLIKKALWLTGNGPVIRRYDTTPDGEIAPAFGTGCSGIVHILIERLTPGRADILDTIDRTRNQRRASVLAHVLGPVQSVGQRLTFDADGGIHHNLSDATLANAIEAEGRAVAIEGVSQHRYIGQTELFFEVVTPPLHLLVFGAGDDAVPVTELAKYLGWQVSVFDGRAHYARRERFRQADEVRVLENGCSGMAQGVDPWTVALLMTHSYSQDLSALSELSRAPLRYLGILGPRKRTVQLLADAGFENGQLAADIHSPMGLDIGADGPEQVALSVIAEIQAVLNGRRGGLLRERQGSIHSAAEEQNSAAEPWIHSIVCA